MFVKWNSPRFNGLEVWSDSRVVNASSHFCLCTNCKQTNILKGIICDKHEKFMKLTQELEIAGPIFSCPDFKESGSYNLMDMYYDGTKFSKEMSGAKRVEAEVKRQWLAQVDKWSKENCD